MKAVEEGDIVLYKLTTTEEIIAKVVELGDDYVVLNRPRVLAPMEAQNGKIGLVMIPWMMGGQDPDSGFESDVVVSNITVAGRVFDAPKSLIDMYVQKTSGIQLVTG